MIRLGPGKNPLFGYNEDWRNHQEKFDLLAGAGANVARQTLVWDDLRNPQFADWRYSDRVYADFLARGIRPLWVLFQDEISSTRIEPPTPAQYDAYADVAARVAARYPNSAGIEIWNEPNLAAFWRSPDPVAYGELVRAATQAVHAVNPGMPVIAAGLFPVDATGTDGVAHDEFLRRAYETGGLQAADAIGAHPYPTGGYDDDYLATIRVRLYEQLETMSEFGDAGKPIWVTETGISTASGKDGFTYVQQADALAAIYAMLRRVANLPVVIFHRFVDDPYAGEIEAGYGVLSEYGVPKPAYCAVAELRGSPC